MIQYLYYVVIVIVIVMVMVMVMCGNAGFNTGYIFKDVGVHTVFRDQRQQAYGFVGFVCSEFPDAN